MFSTAVTSDTKFDTFVDPDVYSPATEKLGESSFLERNFKEKTIDMESNQKSDDSCISLESKDSLPSIGLEKPSIKEQLSQDIKESLEFSNLHERPNPEDSKTTESPLVSLYYVYYIKNAVRNVIRQYILKHYYLLKLQCATLYYHEIVEE